MDVTGTSARRLAAASIARQVGGETKLDAGRTRHSSGSALLSTGTSLQRTPPHGRIHSVFASQSGKTLRPNQLQRPCAIPVHIAIANHQLSVGDLADCQQELQMAASARIYAIWIEGAESKCDLVRGRLAQALDALGRIE